MLTIERERSVVMDKTFTLDWKWIQKAVAERLRLVHGLKVDPKEVRRDTDGYGVPVAVVTVKVAGPRKG